MSGGRAALTGLVVLSLVVTLVPASSAAPISLAPLAAAPPGTVRLELAPLPGSGAMLLAAVAPFSVQFFEVPEDGSSPATPLAPFEIASAREDPSLSGSRLAALGPARAAFAYSTGASVRLAVVDPYLGRIVADLPISAAGEAAVQPSVAAAAGGFAVSYLAVASPGRVVVVGVSADGAVTSRESLPLADASSAALVAAQPTARLAVQRTGSVALYALEAGGLAFEGSLALSPVAGSLWARAGGIHGLFSTAAGLERVRAPLGDFSAAARTTLAFGAGALAVAATESAGGLLLAAAQLSGYWLIVREDSIGSYSTSSFGDASAASAASDSFGLARAALMRGSAVPRSIETLTAGDSDAVAVSLSGPASLLPADTADFTVSVRAVRSPLTVVGLDLALPAGWSVALAPVSLSLATGASAQVSAAVSVPAGAAPGSYVVVATPAVLEIASPSSASLAVVVSDTPALSALCCPDEVDLSPGDTAVVTVTVLNRGETAAVSEVVPEAPAGFIVTPSRTTVTVPGGSSAQVAIAVSASQGTLPLDGGSIAVHIRPADGSPESLLTIPARIRAVFAPELTVAPRDLSAPPGATLPLPFAVVNTGNVGGLVAVEAAVVGLPAASLASLTGPLWVPAFSKVDVPLTLSVPPGALAGTSFEVSASARWGADGATSSGPHTLSGVVRPLAGFAVSYLEGPALLPGGEAEGTLVLSNTGNTKLTFDLAFSDVEAGFTARVADGATSGLVVPAGGRLQVAVLYRAPALAAPGPHPFTVTVTPNAGAAVALPAALEVLQTHGIDLRVVALPPPLANPRTTAVQVDFEVDNRGNAPALVALSFDAPLVALAAIDTAGGSTPADPASFHTIPAHSSRLFRASLAPAFSTGADLVHVRASAESTQGDLAVRAFDLERLRSDPRVVSVTVQPLRAPGQAGHLHQVFAELGNGGPGQAVDLEAMLSADGLVIGRVVVPTLNPGATLLVSFDFVPRKASTAVAVTLVSREGALDRDAGNNALAVTYEAVVPDSSGAAVPRAAAPVAAASLSIVALAALALSEIGKSTLISVLFLPLYVKLKPEEVLDQYLRGQIHGYIIANPGEHYNAIKDQLGVTNGALAYHLRVLERAGLIRPTRDGMYKRFYPVGVKIPKRRRLSSFQETVVKAVRDNPAVSQKRIAELLGVSNQVVNYHVKQLEDAGILKVDRSARASKVFLGPEAPPADAAAPAGTPGIPPPPAQPAGP